MQLDAIGRVPYRKLRRRSRMPPACLRPTGHAVGAARRRLGDGRVGGSADAEHYAVALSAARVT